MRKNGFFVILGLIFGLLVSCGPGAESTPVVSPPEEPATVTEAPSDPAVNTATPAPGGETTQPVKISIPDGALVIAALGDSLTEGQGDDSGLGYPGRLKPMLEQLRPGSEILNFGKSGWAAPDLINGVNGEPSQLNQALEANPNIALVWIGSNDLWYLYEFGPEPMTTEAEQADLAAYEANIDTILSQLTDAGAVVFVALLDDQSKRPVAANPPNPAEPAFPSITGADLELMSAHIAQYNEILSRKAAQYGAITVDFFNTTIFTDSATLYDDGNHPNQAGYEVITQKWYDALSIALGD